MVRHRAGTLQQSDAERAIDDLIGRFFAAFDNRDGRAPASDDLVSLFLDTGIVVRHSGTSVQACSVEDFARPRIDLLTSGALHDFHEWETMSTTGIFGGIATRTSRYCKSGRLHGEPCDGSGTKLFQLVRLAGGWRISSLTWEDDQA